MGVPFNLPVQSRATTLLTYTPNDASFDVAARAPEGQPAHNLIGPIGAFGADLLFQGLGYAAFLLPMDMLALGWKWFRSHSVGSQTATLAGYGLLLLSVPS